MGKLAEYFLWVILFFSTSCKSFVYELFVLRKWNNKRGRYSYFIGLGDFHDKTNKINNVQIRDLYEILKHCLPDTLKIGSENISAPSSGRTASCGRFFVHARGGVLAGFGQICKKLGLPIENLEYRYCRVASLGPVLNNIRSDMRLFPSVRTIKVAELIREVEDVCHEIRLYKDGPLLQDFYQRCIARVNKWMRIKKLYEYKDKTVADYLELMTNQGNRVQFLKKLLTFDSILVDLRLLHSVISAQDHLNYLAVAGGSHITRVAQLISKLGWEWVHATRPDFVREYKIRKCLGGHIIQGKYCRKPKPIDVRMIADFL
jgi:hypothetical protein